MTLAEDRKKLRDAVSAAFNGLGPVGQEALKKTFDKIDTSKDGTINKKELLKYIKNDFGWKIENERFQVLWKLVDADASGSLDFMEVGAVMLLLKTTAQECNQCDKIILDNQLYACLDCWADSMDQDYEIMDGVFCTSCVKSGGKLHKHKLTLIANEWQKHRMQEWLVSQDILKEDEDDGEDEDEDEESDDSDYTTDDGQEEKDIVKSPVPQARWSDTASAPAAATTSANSLPPPTGTVKYPTIPCAATYTQPGYVHQQGQLPWDPATQPPPAGTVVVVKQNRSELVKGMTDLTIDGTVAVTGDVISDGVSDLVNQCAVQ